jgi:hypothetical protein
MSVTLTVFFDDPFYAGMIERVDDGMLVVAKVVFGAEPSDQQVYDWLLENYFQLRFSPPIEGVKEIRIAANPKRRQRQAAKITTVGIGTKSQQAMQLAHEEVKQMRKIRTKEQREQEEERKLQLHIAKKKAKHRGH